jgi:hypothetical protein
MQICVRPLSAILVALALHGAFAAPAKAAEAAIPNSPVSPLDIVGAAKDLPPSTVVTLPNGSKTTVAQYFAQKTAAAASQPNRTTQLNAIRAHGLTTNSATFQALSNPGPRSGKTTNAAGKTVDLDALYQYVNSIKAIVESHGCTYHAVDTRVDLDHYCVNAPAATSRLQRNAVKLAGSVVPAVAGTASTECSAVVQPGSQSPSDQLKSVEHQVDLIKSFSGGTAPAGTTRASLPYCEQLVAAENGAPTPALGAGSFSLPFGTAGDKASLTITSKFSPNIANSSFSNVTTFDALLYSQPIALLNVTTIASAPKDQAAHVDITATAFNSKLPVFTQTFRGQVDYSNSTSDATHSFEFCTIPVVNESIGMFALHADIKCKGSDSFGYTIQASPQLAYVNAAPKLTASLEGTGEVSVVLASATLAGTLSLVNVDARLGGVVGVFKDPFQSVQPISLAVYRPFAFYNVTLFSGKLTVTARVVGAQLATKTLFNVQSQPLSSGPDLNSNWHVVRL